MFIQLNYGLFFKAEEISYVGLFGNPGNTCWIEFNNGRTIEVYSKTNAQAIYEKLIECLTTPQENNKVSLTFDNCSFTYTGVRHPVTLMQKDLSQCRLSVYLENQPDNISIHASEAIPVDVHYAKEVPDYSGESAADTLRRMRENPNSFSF